jgi:hypothetical protein
MIIPVSVSGSTFTANARFPLGDGQQVSIDSRVRNQVPAPLVEYDQDARVYYYLVNVSGNSFQVSATLAGSPITLTSAGIGQLTVSEWPPLTWDALTLLPLVQVSDVRKRFLTPEAMLNLSAAVDTPIGLTVAGSVFTTGIPHSLQDWTAVQLDSSGTLPAPLSSLTTYYLRDTTDVTFTLASVVGGSAITITTAGSGQLSVSNFALNDVIVSKLAIGGQWMYDALLTIVTNHIKVVGRSWWWWWNPSTEPMDVMFYPTTLRAQIVLDNLRNPEKLIDAWVDYTVWAMIQDGSWRNQIINPEFMQQFGPTPDNAAKKRAEQRLAQQVQLLLVSGYQGAHRVFDFGETTSTISISLL